MKFSNKILILFVSILLISFGNKVFSQSSSKILKTFWVGEKGTMYFIDPFKLSVDKNKYLLIDFTFNYNKEIKDSVDVKFTFFDKKNSIKKISKINLNNKLNDINFSDVHIMFKEKKNKFYTYRYSAKISLKEFIDILENPNWEFKVNSNNYITDKKRRKRITKLRENLFFLFDK